MKEYRDEAMKYVDAAERAADGSAADPRYQLNAAIAAALVDIAETLHGIRAAVESQQQRS